MRTGHARAARFAVVAVALLLVRAAWGGEPAPLRAGFASVEITPSRPTRLGGVAGREGPWTAVHDALRARAAVFEQGRRRVAVVSVDLSCVSCALKDAVARATAADGVASGDLLLAATGTRAGPGGLVAVDAFRAENGPFDPALLQEVAARVAAAVHAAAADLRPARLASAHGVEVRPGGPQPGVLRVDGEDGGVRGLLVRYPAHPDTLGAADTAASADWQGALQAALEARFRGATALFLDGPLGFSSPVEGGGDAYERAAAFGRAAAETVAALVPMAKPMPAGVAARSRMRALPPSAFGALLGAGEGSVLAPTSRPTAEIQEVAIGTTVLLAVPGEPHRSLDLGGMRLEGEAWIVGRANGFAGRFLDADAFRRGAADSDACLFGPEIAIWLQRAFAPPGFDVPEPIPTGWGPRAEGPGLARRDGVLVLREGGGFGLGHQHGLGLAREIRELLAGLEKDVETHADRRLAGGEGVRAYVRAARRLQRSIPEDLLEEMEGVAAGAGVPYDAVLLENVLFAFSPGRAPEGLPPFSLVGLDASIHGPLGSALHVTRAATGFAESLAGRAVVLAVEPTEGHPFVALTWPGMVGAATAMGAQGLSVSARVSGSSEGEAKATVSPTLLVREVVQRADRAEDAKAVVDRAKGAAAVVVVDGPRRAPSTLGAVEPPHSDDPRMDLESAALAARSATNAAWACAWLAKPAEAEADRGAAFRCVLEPQVCAMYARTGPVRSTAATDAPPWRPVRLLELLSPAARARYAPPPRVEDVGNVKEGPPVTLGAVRSIAVEFDSPRPSGNARNDRVHASLWLPAEGEPAGAVVLLPAWKERTLVFENLLASAVAGKGFAALLLPMPWQATRNADGVRPGDWTFSADLARTREAWMQGFADVAAASLYLERWRGVPTTRQGVFGVSLGGHVAACAYGAYPERFRAGVFVLAGGGLSTLLVDPPKGLRDLRFTLDGATAEDVKALVGDLDPERWADPARKDGVFLVGAKADELVPARHVEILAKAYGGADVLWLEGGHYDGLKDVDRVLAAAVEHLKRCFGPPR